MSDLFDRYFNIKKMIESKREYRQQMERADLLPEDYRFVYKKIVASMWGFVAGDGYDMMEIHAGLLELFEEGASQGKPVLEVTGEDVAVFCEELLRNAKTQTGKWHERLNSDIARKLGKRDASQ